MNYSFLTRTKIIGFCVLFFALILVGKLFLVQIVHRNSYSERADRQYSTPSSDLFERGTIFFESKDNQLVTGAVQSAGFKVAINPSEITNPQDVYQKLSEKITLDQTAFLAKA